MAASKMSYLQSQVINHCSWNQITPARPFKELADPKFRIVYYKKDASSNIFGVMEVETQQDDLFHLREEIMEVVEDEGLKLSENPSIEEVVLAPNPDLRNEYARAVIMKIEEGNSSDIVSKPVDSTATVFFFDYGGCHEVKLKDMKPVTKPILEFPVLSYQVALCKNVIFSDCIPFRGDGLLLCKPFQAFMDSLKDTDIFIRLFTMEKSQSLAPHGNLSNVMSGSIMYAIYEGGLAGILMEKLKQLKIWEWEQTLNTMKKGKPDGKIDDDSILKNGTYGTAERTISSYEPDSGIEFTAQITRVVGYTSTVSQNAELRMILLDDPLHRNYRTVLQNQMTRYARKVTKSLYTPAIKDLLMFKLDKKEEYIKQGIKGLGQWCRAIQVDSDWIYLLDWDENIPMKGLDSDDYDVRPLYREFLQVPALVMAISPLENGVPIEYEKGLELFIPGKWYKFRIVKLHAEIHEAEYLGPTADCGDDEEEGQKLESDLQEESDSDNDSEISIYGCSDRSTSISFSDTE